jgi:hypothetical protein
MGAVTLRNHDLTPGRRGAARALRASAGDAPASCGSAPASNRSTSEPRWRRRSRCAARSIGAGAVALLVDRAYPEDRVLVPFFGRPTPFSAFSRAPRPLLLLPDPARLLPAAPGRRRTSTSGATSSTRIRRSSPEEDAVRLMSRVAADLERVVRDHPTQVVQLLSVLGGRRRGTAAMTARRCRITPQHQGRKRGCEMEHLRRIRSVADLPGDPSLRGDRRGGLARATTGPRRPCGSTRSRARPPPGGPRLPLPREPCPDLPQRLRAAFLRDARSRRAGSPSRFGPPDSRKAEPLAERIGRDVTLIRRPGSATAGSDPGRAPPGTRRRVGKPDDTDPRHGSHLSPLQPPRPRARGSGPASSSSGSGSPTSLARGT